MFLACLIACAHALTADTAASTGAQDPAWSADGRLAIGIRGDLWVRATMAGAPRWTQVTHGPAWDRQPAWVADGGAIVFTSTASGTAQLWRVSIARDGTVGAPERVTASRESESDAAVRSDGSIAFVRGRGSLARVWIRGADGAERRLTKREADGERWPAWSPDGSRIVYSSVSEARTRLRLHVIAGDSGRVLVEDRDAERAAWSPSGDRIVFATRSPRAGVWVTTPDVRYVNLLSDRRAAPAWSADGRTIALVELPFADVGYNGDPDRLGDREQRDRLSPIGRLWFVDPPVAPDSGRVSEALAVSDRAGRTRETFASVWAQTDSLYFTARPDAHARWVALRDRFAPRASAASSDDALAVILHEMLRERPTLRQPASGRAAVSSAHPVATEAGLEMLRRGGNVVDAAVAVSFALGVVEPDASGIGGYGQMLVRLATMERPTLLEFMSRAPEEATLANGALLRRGAYPDDGPVLVNVPGTVAGMELAHTRYGSGKLSWRELLAPAIRAAERGVVVSEGLATTLATERVHFVRYPASRALFFPNDRALRAGDTLRNPDLARTLRIIADSGAAAFYSGDVGRRIVSDLRGRGNAMRVGDLARYFAVEREPVSGRYRGYTVFSSAPPASGGPALVAQLNHLELHPAAKPYDEDAATLHAMIEAWKLVPSTRGRIADPGLWPIRLDAFLSKDSATVRWNCFRATRALTPDDVRGDTLPCAGRAIPTAADSSRSAMALDADRAECDEHEGSRRSFCHRTGTTAFTVADAAGNVVSVTQTLGTWGGNFYVSPGLGFLYNDKLTSYGSDPDEYGARLANARHGSSLAPTIVFRGEGRTRRPVLVVGAAGNAWITSAVYSIVTGVIDGKLDVQRAIEQPRFLIGQQRGDARREYLVQIEDGMSPSAIKQLEAMGHLFQRISLAGELRMGYASAITLDGDIVTAGADPRRAGEAGAIGCAADAGRGCRR
ncbi:MAG: gamma-glutamyltransferase [Gemmatimonadaceae bacterium]|nr:gamma-glutamyltransferase [Gemmatimonadaceae bacterium]